jgi:hypothetical protein
VSFAAAVVLAYVLLRRRWRTTLGVAVACAIVIAWWLTIPPSNDRAWLPEYAVTPSVEISGERLTVHGLRDFRYRTTEDFDERWTDRTYDLAQLEGVDLVLSYWDGNEAIAHSMLSFAFRVGQHLAVSGETRREIGEPQGTLRSLFKQYELIFLLADERDVFGLRTNYRREDVYLYPTTITPQDARVLLLDILEHVNRIHEHSEFYNLVVANCTTSLLPHIAKIRPQVEERPWRERLKNGFSDRRAWESGLIADASGTFEEVREHHRITGVVDAVGDDYSSRIRAAVR